MQPVLPLIDDVNRIRARAMLKLLFVAGSFLLFLLLGCALIAPPPPLSFVFAGESAPALLPGASRTFTVTVLDNLNHQPAAYSHIDIALVSYPTTGKNSYQKLRSVQTNRTGQFTFTLTLPPTVSDDDQFQLHFHAPDEASGQDVYQAITLVDEIAMTFPAWPTQTVRGATVQITALISDSQQQQPAVGAVITVTQRFYHQESGWEENRAPVATMRTDERGQIQFPYTIPMELNAGDQIELAFQVQSDEHHQAYNQVLLVQPAATLELLGAPYTLMRGAKTVLTARVQEYHHRPLPDAKVEAWGGGQQLAVGTTDSNGVVNLTVQAPADFADPTLNINLVASAGVYQAEQSHYLQLIEAPANLLITTDKPIYQPGQIIHVRTLLLNALSLQAQAAATIYLELYDSRGNRLIQRQLTTSDFGIASADFALDSQAMSGDYRIDAYRDQGVTASRAITVKPYHLPRFKVEFQGDRTFYQPGETATGEIHAAYFFGKAVAGGAVTIMGYATDPAGNGERVAVVKATGLTNEQGRYTYALPLPMALTAQLRAHRLTLDLEIQVTDTAQHSEISEEALIIADQPLLIEAVAESGILHRGVENIVYLQLTYPDGQPAQATVAVTVGDEKTTATTDRYGLATVRVTPPVKGRFYLTVRATTQTQRGAPATIEEILYLPSGQGQAAVLLRPARAEIATGESLPIELLVKRPNRPASKEALVLLQVYKAQQLYQSEVVVVQQGHTTTTLTLDPSLLGTVEIYANLLDDTGQANPNTGSYGAPVQSVASDQRLVLINPAAIALDVQATAAVYQPGATAELTVQATHNGEPLQGALGISIVDEAVFALGAQDPGFARTYFLVARELLEPRFGIHGFTPFDGESSPYTFGDRYSATPGHAAVATLATKEHALFALLAEELLATRPVQAASSLPLTATPPRLPPHTNMLALFFALTVIGLTVHRVRRTPRQTLLIVSLLLASLYLWSACAPAASPAGGEMSAPAQPAPPPAPATGTPAQRETAAKPRLRQSFPETLFWLPELPTDAAGRAHFTVPLADTITTWRVSIIASDKMGNLGSAQVPLRVFQDFFVEPLLPATLSQGDEIDVPVSIYNYLDKAQTIKLEVTPAPWFALRTTGELSLTLAANEVSVRYIPLRIVGVGDGAFTLTAHGSAMNDAIVRHVTVNYNAEARTIVANGEVTGALTYNVPILADAVPGATALTLKLYPNPGSQLLSGLTGLLHKPTGCFEQSSSVNYTNLLILDYLQATGRNEPYWQSKTERLAELGYQRLLNFEVQPMSPGGFSFYGRPTPDLRLTAYALRQLTAAHNHIAVDNALIERTTAYLLQQQQENGSWFNEPATTATVLRALNETEVDITKAVAYLTAQLATPLPPYTLALVTEALVTAKGVDPAVQSQALDRLAALAQRDAAGFTYWPAGEGSWLGGTGRMADFNTTALSALAFLHAGQHLDLAQAALTALLAQRDQYGSFYTTENTALALQAFTRAAQRYTVTGETTLIIRLNGGAPQTVTINDATQANVLEFPFASLAAGPNQLTIIAAGDRRVPYQIITDYQLPWTVVAAQAAATSPAATVAALRVDVAYEQNTVVMNEQVAVTATVTAFHQDFPNAVIAELGLPPGFTPQVSDLAALVEQQKVDFYEVRGDKLVLYLSGLTAGQAVHFPYRLQASLPGVVQTPPSLVYAYYTPDVRDVDAPQTVVVK